MKSCWKRRRRGPHESKKAELRSKKFDGYRRPILSGLKKTPAANSGSGQPNGNMVDVSRHPPMGIDWRRLESTDIERQNEAKTLACLGKSLAMK
jgi:hypothetical protein